MTLDRRANKRLRRRVRECEALRDELIIVVHPSAPESGLERCHGLPVVVDPDCRRNDAYCMLRSRYEFNRIVHAQMRDC